MTTRNHRIHRERAGDWPLFRGIPTGDAEVVSIEVHRDPSEPLSTAATDASIILTDALRRVLSETGGGLVLLALGNEVPKSRRVAAFNATRDKVWASLEKQGMTLPSGNRIERDVSKRDETLRFAGIIELGMRDLPAALEVTRRENAICIGRADGCAMTHDFLLSLVATEVADTGSLVRTAVKELPEGLFVARATGRFDDTTIAVDVISGHGFLRELEVALRR